LSSTFPTKPSHTTTSIGPRSQAPDRDVAPLDVPEEGEVGLAQQELVRLLDHDVPLLGLLADREQPHGRVGTAEHVLGVHRADARELHELLGEQSTLAPESSTTTGRRAVGNSVLIAGRVSPACRRSTNTDPAICAPVLPAETNASECPSTCRRSPTTMELCGLPRSATVGLSDIRMTSGASTIVMRSR
jgi:hypothetical protein